MKRQIVAFLLAVSMTLSCCGCGHSSAVNQATMVLNQLERSFNSCDVDGVVNCFESDVQEVYNVILSLIDVIALDDLKSNGKKSKAYIDNFHFAECGNLENSMTAAYHLIIDDDIGSIASSDSYCFHKQLYLFNYFLYLVY